MRIDGQTWKRRHDPHFVDTVQDAVVGRSFFTAPAKTTRSARNAERERDGERDESHHLVVVFLGCGLAMVKRGSSTNDCRREASGIVSPARKRERHSGKSSSSNTDNSSHKNSTQSKSIDRGNVRDDGPINNGNSCNEYAGACLGDVQPPGSSTMVPTLEKDPTAEDIFARFVAKRRPVVLGLPRLSSGGELSIELGSLLKAAGEMVRWNIRMGGKVQLGMNVVH